MTHRYTAVHLRYAMRSIGLDRNLERDLIVFHKASLGVSYILRSACTHRKYRGSISQSLSRRNEQIVKTNKKVAYTPGHEVGETPVVLFVEEQVADAPAERLLIVLVVDDFQHGLSMT